MGSGSGKAWRNVGLALGTGGASLLFKNGRDFSGFTGGDDDSSSTTSSTETKEETAGSADTATGGEDIYAAGGLNKKKKQSTLSNEGETTFKSGALGA